MAETDSLVGRQSSPGFLELLPATKYSPTKLSVATKPTSASARDENTITALPTKDEIDNFLNATRKRRSSSTSTASSVATSSSGDRRRYLELLPILSVTEADEYDMS
ncbi:hypothetical protein MMC12_001545 [Toensbergia leucococca]|nr:hypothetical protein [Toensbergia leucococca]